MREDGFSFGISRLAALLAWAACGIACAVGLGYLLENTTLTSFQPGWKPMAPVTALVIVGLAVPLMVPGSKRRPSWMALAIVVSLAALAMLASHAVFQSDILSPWLAGKLGIAPELVGKASIPTSVCLLLLGGASIAGQRRALAGVEWLANIALLISSSALLGYTYGISGLYSYYMFNPIALPTALALFSLALALLVREPETRLGMAARAPHASGRRLRLMLALTAMPALLGWLLLNTRDLAIGNESISTALLVMSTSVPMFYLLLEYAHTSELLIRTRDAQERDAKVQALLLQEEVARIAAQLAVTHRHEVTSQAQLERSKRSEVIAQLTGSIAHDFNNLLMVIGGSAQLMKLQMPAGHALMRHVDKISTTVAATARLTAQLAAFSRTQRLAAEPVSVDAVVRAAIADMEGALPPTIRLNQALSAGNAWVLGDRTQLQLAIGHLLRNAEEALNGHGTLAISTSTSSAAPDAREGIDTVIIRIEDDGCGMAPDVLANATEPFFTTKPAGKHQGLGLAQVSAVVHQASGSLHVTSTPGAGSAIEICLPRHVMRAKPPRPGMPERPLTLAGTGNRRLLVIDDDPDVRSVIVELLRSMHYEVSEAQDGETGLRKLEQVQPALAIIDYLMPGMNGGELARKARQQFPALPILFISGYADSEAIAAIPHAQLLRKPILPKELEQAVTGALADA